MPNMSEPFPIIMSQLRGQKMEKKVLNTHKLSLNENLTSVLKATQSKLHSMDLVFLNNCKDMLNLIFKYKYIQDFGVT